MSEQQPLLPVQSLQPDDQVAWHTRIASCLESRGLHKTVITLITVDAACVLADLIYTFLSPTCTPEGPDAPKWLEVLAHISLVITTLFLIEVPMALWAFGPQYYNPFGPVIHSALHLFDALIIVTTFVLEVVLKGRERELAGLLIILRLWRLVKLVGGLAVGAGEIGEEDARELASLRNELDKAKTDLSAMRDENLMLKRRLATLEHPS